MGGGEEHLLFEERATGQTTIGPPAAYRSVEERALLFCVIDLL